MSMSKSTVEAAIDHAERFIADARALLAEIEGNVNRAHYNPATGKMEPVPVAKAPAYACSPGKQSGTTRRRSMDLTRALAEMRKPV